MIEYKFCLQPFYQCLHALFLSLFPSIPSHKMLQAKGSSIVIKWHLQTERFGFFFFPKAPGYLSFITCLRRGHHSLTTNIWPKRPPNLKQQTNYCHLLFPAAFIFIYFFLEEICQHTFHLNYNALGFFPLSILNFLLRGGNPHFINQFQLPTVFCSVVLTYELEEYLD